MLEVIWFADEPDESQGCDSTGDETSDSYKYQHAGECCGEGILKEYPRGQLAEISTQSPADDIGEYPERNQQHDNAKIEWSPDGVAFAVVRAPQWRYRLEFPLGKVLYETTGWISHPRVSPDGDAVAFVDHPAFGDDLGMQSGPQMSPAMYREFFKPRHARMWKRAKELADVKVMLHCCGGVRELLPDLIDAGLDAINPVQISCKGMDAAGLKRDFGDSMVFWGGGCDTQRALVTGTPDEVRRHVREQICTLAPGGGFVFQQVHNILANVSPQNVVAMFEAAGEF